MINLFNIKFTHKELVSVILSNSIIFNELELELVTLWVELSRYSDEAWEEIGEGGSDNVRKVTIYLPKIGETLIRNNWQEDATVFIELGRIIEKITGLEVKDLYMVDNEEFEIEFSNPIPRPRKHVPRC